MRATVQAEAIDHLHPRPPDKTSDADLLHTYVDAVKADLFGDDLVCEVLCWRYSVSVFMFLPIHPVAVNQARSSIPRPKQYNRTPGDRRQKVAFILATDLGVQHFEPIDPMPGVPARDIPNPSYFTAADRARERDQGFCIVSSTAFTTPAMRDRVRSNSHCQYALPLWGAASPNDRRCLSADTGYTDCVIMCN
jgi:hypothetical protein